MAEFLTVAQVLASAERARPGAFKVAQFRAERRPGEPFERVQICYWLGASRDLGRLVCGIDYIVSDDPPHISLLTPDTGLGRELEHSRARFIRALDCEIALERDPAVKSLGDLLAPVNPYDHLSSKPIARTVLEGAVPAPCRELE
ncbi:hypothetical protein [Methylobacterium sp. JK268]